MLVGQLASLNPKILPTGNIIENMKDYNTYYHLKYNGIRKGLEKRFEMEVAKGKGSKVDSKNSFLAAVQFEQNNIYKCYTPNIPGASEYEVVKNYFKELIIKEFRNMKTSFPEDPVNGFVEHVIPNKRSFHQERYESGIEKDYEFDPGFMYDASTEEILDMIAKYYAYKDFLRLDFPKLVDDIEGVKQTDSIRKSEDSIKFEEAVDRSKKNSSYPILTQEESVLLVKCLREENLILSDRYLNNTNLAKVAYYLTGFASGPFRKKLSNPISGYSKAQKQKLAEKLIRIVGLLE